MKVILITVSSLDGKVTKWKDSAAHVWTSAEDFEHFKKIRDNNNLIVMGSGTFDVVKNYEQAGLKPQENRLRIILTSKPEKYKQYIVPGQMEFSDETPKHLISRLEKEGFRQMLLVSGGKVATSFFKKNLIDEFWLTIEPRIFGIGEPLVQEMKLDVRLELRSMEKLNSLGTLLLKYKVLKS